MTDELTTSETSSAGETSSLIFSVTDQYRLAWNDHGSGGDNDGAFWIPLPPDGYFVGGMLALGNYDDPNGQVRMQCFKAPDSDPTALAPPAGYAYIWDDSGSGAAMDGSCWRPQPPDGYVALGDAFVEGHGEPFPGSLPVMCVRRDLAALGMVGNWIYDDRGSGADRDISVWQVVPASGSGGQSGAYFIADNTYGAPPTMPVYVLPPPQPASGQ